MTRLISTRLALLLVCAAAPSTLLAQAGQLEQLEQAMTETVFPPGEGWGGFLQFGFLLNMFLTLLLASLLGAIIGFHPKHIASADTLEEIDAPKVYIFYAVIGAIMGILVVKYGLVVGFVLFGIGGLIRFRTIMRSANLTGRVIFVTLIGLTCGLNLPHVAVLATLFAFLLVYVIETRVTYRVDIQGLDIERFGESVSAYRALLEQNGCHVLSERKNPNKGRISLLVSGPHGVRREKLEELVESGIEGRLKGSVDWETD